ncbi:MAG: hypothetical protein AB7N91_22580, partial [Candidatus Tectimicrobiota bacterium]
ISGRIHLERAAALPWNQWQRSGGTGGSFAVESVAGFTWNRWQLCHGIRILETLGFFTPSSTRMKDIYTKEKIVGELGEPDGTRRLITTKISANHELGLPITADLDYYRAFLKILADAMAREGRLRLPLAVPTKLLLRHAAKPDGSKTRHEVRTFLKKMTLTGIEGGVYQAKTRTVTEGFVTTVFRQVVMRGELLRHGRLAETNYVWPAPWFLANYLRGHVRRVDLTLHHQLRRPLAKALYPLLATGWYAAGGQAYAKRYAALCQDFLLTPHHALSRLKQQLDPAHQELRDQQFLDAWAYRQAADQQGWVLWYWPGPQFFADAALDSGGLPPRSGSQTVAEVVPAELPTAEAQLLEEILAVCRDRHHTTAYRKAVRAYPAALLRRVLADTRQAVREGRIRKTRGAFFFDTLHRLAALPPA